MKIIAILVLLTLVIPVSVFAQRGEERGRGQQNQAEKQTKEVDVLIDTDEEIDNEEENGDKKDKGGKEKGEEKSRQRGSERSAERRSQVANAVKEILMVAERSGGIGEQIRTIAQTQNQAQEQAEEAIQKAQKRSKFAKFLIGPNYGQLKKVEESLGVNAEQLKQLKELKNQVENSEDVAILEQEIYNIEQARADLELEVKNEKKGFSLFGWMNKLLS